MKARSQDTLYGVMLSLFFFAGLLHGASAHVVIISGKGGTSDYSAKFSRHAKQMHEALTKRHYFAEEQIIILSETGTALPCTAPNVESTFIKLAGVLKPEDVFFLILIGHGTADASFAKFNLIGSDLRDFDFARLLEHIPARQQVVINTAPASAGFIEKLTRDNRIIITATRSAEEKYATVFAEYFVEALQKGEEADLNKDQKISLLEAFDYTRDRVVRFYEQANRLRPEHPLLDDNGDGVGSEIPLANAFTLEVDARPVDGALAARIWFAPATSDAPRPTAENGGLAQKKARLLADIENLKSRKQAMSVPEYERKLEELFIALARLNREIKASTP